MFKIFFLLLLVVVAVSALPRHRRSISRHLLVSNEDSSSRIVNGVEVSLGEIPWQVSFRRESSSNPAGSHFCGGSIINKDWILCAAHCVSGTDESGITDRIHAGILELSEIGQKRAIRAIIQHSGYSSSTFENDISLINLQEPLVLGGNVGPIDMPNQQAAGSSDGYIESIYDQFPNNPSEGNVGTVFIVSGWGTESFGLFSPLSNELLKTNVAYVPDDTCDSGNGEPSAGYKGQITEGMICAGGIGANHDSCQGDSGGPMVLESTQTSPWSQVTSKQVGIVSWGSGCASDGKPGVYTQLSFYRNWVDAAIKCYEADPKPPATQCD